MVDSLYLGEGWARHLHSCLEETKEKVRELRTHHREAKDALEAIRKDKADFEEIASRIPAEKRARFVAQEFGRQEKRLLDAEHLEQERGKALNDAQATWNDLSHASEQLTGRPA
jgi:hypothetical protein